MSPMSVPEEVDVFSIPHSRMKELVDDYFHLMESTNFANMVDLEILLQTLLRTFSEFKTHEQIENKFIMKKLKSKLKQLSISNTAVCNCHKDSKMTSMLQLLQDGYTKKTAAECRNYEIQLKEELYKFTGSFLPHMQEEEEVFQPLLLEYFTYDELVQIKSTVIQQHKTSSSDLVLDILLHQQATADTDSTSATESEDEGCKDVEKAVAAAVPAPSITSLPQELLLGVLSHLGPQELLTCTQVCQDWRSVAMDGSLWHTLLPRQWAQGDWSFTDSGPEEVNDEGGGVFVMDDDADIDTSEPNFFSDALQMVENEKQVLSGVLQSLMPRIGSSVTHLSLGDCRTLTDSMLHHILTLCPNMEHLDLSQTRVSDIGLRRMGKNGCGAALQFLSLSGCVNITDAAIARIAAAVSQPKHCDKNKQYNTNNCYRKAEPEAVETGCGSRNQPGTAYGGDCDTCNKDSGSEKVQAMNNESLCCQAISNEKAQPYCCNNGGGQMCGKRNNGNSDDGQRETFLVCPFRGESDTTHCPLQPQPTAARNPTPHIQVVDNQKKYGRPPEADTVAMATGRSQQQGCDFLQHLDLSGCFQITDYALRVLAGSGVYSHLSYLDLSGCLKLTAPGLHALVAVCPALKPANLFYCDNIVDGPLAGSASGCRNLQCNQLVCCRSGD